MTSLTGRTVTLIHESEFSKLVTETYGRPYRFQQQDGCRWGQDTVYLFDVPHPEGGWESIEEFRGCYAEGVPTVEEWANTPIGDYEHSWQTELHWRREFYPPFEAVIDDLHARGLIDAGSYGLHIWW
ncbi:hypothetical protein [Nocardia ignorata]|uniref:Uncharacterized protein n=1 Tax=Nocardia ignorata TaxID=145285 RepID=A0A4R6NZX0_NOCIG|nr:hypothetical protein [Nocardia ignorata]TDP29888.1 hypothetical protein DFR75_112157 [Nocardia ignorata]